MAIFLKAKWENIIMANYPVAAETLKPFMPKGVELDLYHNKAYVSLVGFMFKKSKLFQIPIPWLGTFEEINLRFYVVRKDADGIKRGVVFINETIPYKAVAWIANKLYKEHYTSISTKHSCKEEDKIKLIEYQWQVNKNWNSISVEALIQNNAINQGSFEEFIFEHYFGYTKINKNTTEEYTIKHPSWKVNQVINSKINCDFNMMYGKCFDSLNLAVPDSVFIAEGSPVEVEWKRTTLNLQ
jgi:uncharacterized protein YqjF (DUF2071 family)